MFQSSYLTSYCPPFSSKVRVGEHDTKHDGPDCQNGMVKLCNSGVQDFDIEYMHWILPQYKLHLNYQNTW